MGQPPFEALVEAHHEEIHRYLLRVTARASEAQDLSQETFLRAYRAYRALAPDANVRAWLFTIATNLSRNYFRGEKRRRLAHAAASSVRTETDCDGPDIGFAYDETRRRVEAIAVRLPLKQRQAFVLRKIHDLDYETIAGTLACSVESARAHVFQALRKLRRGLGADAPGPLEPRS